MATQPVAGLETIYPLGTRSGDSIPLDVISPVGLFVVGVQGAAPVAATLPADYALVSIYATDDCVMQFNSVATTLAEGVNMAGSVFVPAQTLLTMYLVAAPFTVLAINSALVGGVLFIQKIVKYQALAIPQQFSNQS